MDKLFAGVCMRCGNTEMKHRKDQGPAEYKQDEENPEYIKLYPRDGDI